MWKEMTERKLMRIKQIFKLKQKEKDVGDEPRSTQIFEN